MKDHNPVSVYTDVQVNFAMKGDTLWGNGRTIFDTPIGTERPHVIRVAAPKSKPKSLGAVTATFMLDEHGEPGEFHVATSDTEIENAVVDALKEWRFIPAMKNGVTIAVAATVDFVGLRLQ
jgi:TonB family protein